MEVCCATCLTITETKNTERSKGTITNQGSSGTEGVEVEIGLEVGVGGRITKVTTLENDLSAHVCS
ncbi:MAG TPA: hypothetical protein VJY36_01845 [Candidatus Bathyarchaeia archaeon]|nr:hypothetical protein [Candidatus Bathyarchaeia archaeon]